MTALNKYQRLEASGLWRANAEAQRSEVIVSIGDATLVITDLQDRALAHWSLAAVERANPGTRPAIYHPDGDPGETLELAENETQMIDAIEKLRGAIARQRPHPGRLRLISLLASLAVVMALAIFWLPNAARDHAVRVVPQVKRAEIGAMLWTHIQMITGPACQAPEADRALAQLAVRLPAPDGRNTLVVVRNGVDQTAHLPGGTILIGHTLVEDYEDPAVLAGYVIAERLRAQMQDPLDELLRFGGLGASIRLLATGEMQDAVLKTYAQTLLTTPARAVEDDVLLAGFKAWKVPSAPYAYARDVSGEQTLGLIEADPFAGASPNPVLSDADWLRLQSICGG